MHEEAPYIFFNSDEFDKLLDDASALREYINSLPSSEEVREAFSKTIADSLEKARQLSINQPGEVSDLCGKYNFVLHKLFKGALLGGYALASLVLKAKAGYATQGMTGFIDDGGRLIEGAKEIYKSIEKVSNDFDKVAIIEAIESISFARSYITLQAPGPTLDEINEHLKKNNHFLDDLKGMLKEMEEARIVNMIHYENLPDYYQLRYVTDWIVG